jgi:hypothetical protein
MVWKSSNSSVIISPSNEGAICMAQTMLALPAGKKISVPRLLKRALQITLAVALSSTVCLVMIAGNGLLIGRGASVQAGVSTWLAFIRRSDILGTMIVTAIATVFVVYWLRERER